MHTVFSSEMKNKNSHQISFLNLIIVMLLVETFFLLLSISHIDLETSS